MDEGTLNDLLECSVCLERLDTSSKVLPCQHTFCKKCLQEIVDSHKELRCPECRVLVPSRVDELPPNVLLMRILEGMRNAAPKKQLPQQRLLKDPQSPVIQHSTPVHHHGVGTPDHRHKLNKQPSPHQLINAANATHQSYAKAMYDFQSKEPGELNFKRGEIIIVKKRIDTFWHEGECGGRKGLFPLNYVQIITPIPSHIPQCKALFDFRMTNDEEEGCLTFSKGDIIAVIRRVDENWAEGKLDGRVGIFPLAFVELNNLARSLMKLSTNAQPGPSRVAPPTPTADDSAPLIPTDHTRNVGSVPVVTSTNTPKHSAQPASALPTSDSSSTVSSGGSSTTTTPNTSSSNTSSSSSTAPSSPASPPPRSQNATIKKHEQSTLSTPQRHQNPPPRPEAAHSSSHHHHHNREKRHSFTSLTPPHHHSNTHRHSAEILSPDTTTSEHGSSASSNHGSERHRRFLNESSITLPTSYVALYPYKPQNADELELKKGGVYTVTERCKDGWFKGTSNRTQKCGVFPGNYVTPAVNMIARSTQQHGHVSGSAAADQLKCSSTSGGVTVSYTRKSGSPRSTNLPPELPPRSTSPPHAGAAAAISTSWHGQQRQQEAAVVPLGRSSSAVMSSVSLTVTPPAKAASSDKPKERKEKGTVSLMRRLTSMKRSKSPPPSSYSMDNPVFEDSSVSTSHPVHVRSGSCPSQLLQQVQPAEHHRIFQSTSQRLKHKERPSVLLTHSPRTSEGQPSSLTSSPNVHHHRKSHSLDAGSRTTKTTSGSTQTVRERFRCIAPYPPNSEYELELQVNDIIYVHKKRDDGWYKGTQQRTGRTGLFPASFVEAF